MLSMAVQPGIINGGVFTQTSLPSKTLTFKPFKSFMKPKLSSFHSYKSLDSKQTPTNTRRRELILSASATSVEAEEEDIEDGLLTVIDEHGVEVKENKVEEVEAAATPPSPYETDEDTEEVGVYVNPFEKPRLVLKFIWMEKNIGLALDQNILDYGSLPLSPYYFWPRKDAWDELKTVIESKPWISHKKKIILLNHATDVIDLWQQSGGNLSRK